MRLLSLARRNRLPELGSVVGGAAIHVDQAGVVLGAKSDQPAGPETGKVDADRDAFAQVGIVVIDQPFAGVKFRQRVGVEQSVAAAKTDLRQPRALAHQHGKRQRADLGIERAMITGLDAVEAAHVVGDHAREYVEPPGRAFRIGGGGDVARQGEALDQRHDIDAARLQHARRRRGKFRAA